MEAIKDEGLQSYVRQYVKTQSSPLAMGQEKGSIARYKELYDGFSQEHKTIDEKGANAALESLEEGRRANKAFKYVTKLYIDEIGEKRKVSKLPKEERELFGMYDNLRAHYKARLPKGNLEYIKEHKPEFADPIEELTDEQMWELEKKLFIRDIYEGGTIAGQKIKPQDLKEIRVLIDRMIDSRKEFDIAIKASSFMKNLAEIGFGYDFKNSAFRKTAAAKKLLPYVTYEPNEKFMQIDNVMRTAYASAVQAIFNKLVEKGYTILKDLDGSDVGNADVEIEKARQAEEKRLNEDREKPVRFDFPTMKVNGKEYKLFTETQQTSFKKYIGKEIHLDGRKGEELAVLMQEQDALARRMAGSRFDANMKAGIYMFIFNANTNFSVARMKEIAARVKKLLG